MFSEQDMLVAVPNNISADAANRLAKSTSSISPVNTVKLGFGLTLLGTPCSPRVAKTTLLLNVRPPLHFTLHL
jgi:hypothetical protein